MSTIDTSTDIAERLRAMSADAKDWNGTVLKAWDRIRQTVESHKGGDLPRLMFESLIEDFTDLCDAASDVIEAQRSSLATARRALEQVAVVCTDNMDRDCDHRMALDFVRQVANDHLTALPVEAAEPVAWREALEDRDQLIFGAAELLDEARSGFISGTGSDLKWDERRADWRKDRAALSQAKP